MEKPPGSTSVTWMPRGFTSAASAWAAADFAEILDLAEQPRADRLVQGGQGLGHVGERDDVGQRGTRPEHGGRHDQVLRGPGQLGDADQHERGERPGRGQDPGGVGERVGRRDSERSRFRLRLVRIVYSQLLTSPP